MPTETIPSLLDLQRSTPEALTTLANATRNRQLSIACTLMASAMHAHSLGDRVQMLALVERCKVAHARAQEDLHGQVLRVRQVAAVIASAVRS
jgi:hypothetical protein